AHKLAQAVIILSSRMERATEDLAARTSLAELLLQSNRANDAKRLAAATLQTATVEAFRRRLQAILRPQ
ncbi:hypothetical protein ACK0UV_29140, partial [Bacillus anthracis]|uniref:hypothetical protein n=1 Tax=Bacillus anthracis TaxID=1392 RepID=UPI003904B766